MALMGQEAATDQALLMRERAGQAKVVRRSFGHP